MSTLIQNHQREITSLIHTFTSFKQQVIDVLSELSTFDEDILDLVIEDLAAKLDQTPAFLTKSLEGVRLLKTMPTLFQELREDYTFDLDRLAALGTQSRKFEHIDPDELESVLRELIFASDRSPSPSRISRAIRDAEFEKSKLIPKPEPKQQDASEVSMTLDEETDTATLRFPCTPSEFSLIKRLITEHAEEQNCSITESVLHLLRGGKRPRTNIIAIDVEGEEIYVEGKGWIPRTEFEISEGYLAERTTMTAKQFMKQFLKQ